MRVLAIGGTRFIGLYTVLQLVKMGHAVTVFHRGQTTADLPDGVEEILGDMHELEQHQSTFEKLKPDVVIHNMLVEESDGQRLMDVFRGIAGRAIAISSCDVYLAYGRLIGSDPGEPVASPTNEDAPLRVSRYPYRNTFANNDPAHPRYNYDKIPIEELVLADDELPGTVLRLPMVYGPRDYQRRIYPYLQRMDDQRPAILLDQSAMTWRAPRGYVEEVGRAIAIAATDERAQNRIYNIGENDNITEVEWIKAIADVVGWQGEIMPVEPEKMPEDMRFNTNGQDLGIDSTRIRTELDYAEEISRSEGIRRTIEYDRANPPEQAPPVDYTTEDKLIAELKKT